MTKNDFDSSFVVGLSKGDGLSPPSFCQILPIVLQFNQ